MICQFTEWLMFLILWQASVLILKACSALLICNKKANIKKNLWRLNHNYDDTTGFQCTINAYFATKELLWKIFVLEISWENMHLVCTQNFLKFFSDIDQELACALYKKWSFPFRTSSVNVIKSAGNWGFGHIYWRNP